MSINPYLLWIVGAVIIEDDPRFNREVYNKLMENTDLWEIEVPILVGEGTFDDFDLVTGRPLKHSTEKRPTLGELYYYGSPMCASPDEPDKIIGYIMHKSHDRHLLRGLTLVPGFEELFLPGGFIMTPQRTDLEADPEYRQLYHREQAEKALEEYRFIEMYRPWYTDHWYSVAIHILHLVGWTGIKRKHLRPYMIWGWS